MKRTSLLLVIGIIALILVGAYTAYAFWQRSVSEADLKLLDKSLATVKEDLLQNENQQILQAISAKQTVNDLKSNMVKWSEVIKKIRSTIPNKGGLPLVEILSYSGSAGRDISMNVKTIPASENPYFDVADLIKAFTTEKTFVDAFVPSISAGTDEDGNEVLTFSINMKYQTADELEAALGDILNESLNTEEAAPAETAETVAR